jgi:hypothetical protein
MAMFASPQPMIGAWSIAPRAKIDYHEHRFRRSAPASLSGAASRRRCLLRFENYTEGSSA